jgi:hypothetical protein
MFTYIISILSAAVADRGHWMGCVSHNVHTADRLYMPPSGPYDNRKDDDYDIMDQDYNVMDEDYKKIPSNTT